MQSFTIRPVSPGDFDLVAGLSELLIDSVACGASVGFLSPLSQRTAQEYWTGVLDSLEGGLYLWVAIADATIVGSVQLQPCAKQNGRHRAEVQKLLVLTSFRGRGISSRLMQTIESFARSSQITLLVLDTLSGTTAEAVYKHLGWQRAGEIPQYAASPDGQLHATAYYYKLLSH